MRPSRLPLLLLATLAAPALRADGLGDLKAALQRLPATQNVKTSIDYQFWNQSTEDKQPKVTQGRAQATGEDGPAGLRLAWSRATVDQAWKESLKKDDKGGTRQAIQAMDAVKAAQLLNAGAELLRGLDGAQLAEDRPEAWQGHAARLLVLKLDNELSAEEKKHIKTYSHTRKLWLDVDGTPLAEEDAIDMKGSYLLISFEMHQKASRAFTRSGDRLVTTWEQKEEGGSGLGQSSQQKSVVNVKVS